MQEKQQYLVLMGLRGSGKSTLGRLVASRLGLSFVDLDEVTTSLLGVGTLAELWAKLGEPAFREAESRAIRQCVLETDGCRRLVALGGGTPTAPGAADLLHDAVKQQRIVLVYLRGQPETLRTRLALTETDKRPTLTGAGTLAEIESVFASRDGLYQELATHVIEIDRHSADALAETIALLIE